MILTTLAGTTSCCKITINTCACSVPVIKEVNTITQEWFNCRLPFLPFVKRKFSYNKAYAFAILAIELYACANYKKHPDRAIQARIAPYTRISVTMTSIWATGRYISGDTNTLRSSRQSSLWESKHTYAHIQE